ncbi:MAG: carbamoyl-phosphate synthase large subunit [Deltaproteobacteria bacterium]|nr:carbamoyl-phosphate synthase large subunit [Deltaproteobacteria bacterium]
MPRRDDLSTILLVGSGPIVIGQACEFDYSGTQACRMLKAQGYRVVLHNSNPATIMTDPQMADATYVEPLTVEAATRIIELEKPDALLPTLGGQTALNLAVDLAKAGVLEAHGVELIGATLHAIEEAEDRDRFQKAMHEIGLKTPLSRYIGSLAEARETLATIPLPWILRPSFTLGGGGGSVVEHEAEIDRKVEEALRESPNRTVLLETSIAGWKEYELEVMRDRADNAVIVCSIENLDPMGVHTGDSITVAPAQTLTDREYQVMRDSALAILRRIGVDTGGCNIQYAVNPDNGDLVVIEMNPRVSRSSALASKATGFPIAKFAALLAVGFTLDEIESDITKKTKACFEPSIDYVVTKIPRFAFEKFPGADTRLTTAMKSVGEVMALGRTLEESLGKALASMEVGCDGLELWTPKGQEPREVTLETIRAELSPPGPDRLRWVAEGLRRGLPLEEVFERTKIDRWFLRRIAKIVAREEALRAAGLPAEDDARTWRELKRAGLSDGRIAALTRQSEAEVRRRRKAAGVVAVYKRVDTCGAEFEAFTPYLYSTYEDECEAEPSGAKKVIILGSGPNRIGQGIEFDYCCVQAAYALKEAGVEAIMVNCNPETVSTDYDTADRLYFEPLTFEHVLAVIEREQQAGEILGVIVQFGGQTPLKLAAALEAAGVPILGTPPAAIDRAEDRERFAALLNEQGLRQPAGGLARSEAEALQAASKIGFPVMVRPSYVLGGRAMEIVHDEEALKRYVREATDVSPDHPILIDRFLRDAVEVDVDVVFDGKEGLVSGVMEHIEEAGIHSGDSACALPPFTLGPEIVRDLARISLQLARELGVVGLMNVQFALLGRKVYLIEVNPRASRTVPFVGKATGVPVARLATLVMLGRSLHELGYGGLPDGLPPSPQYFAVKEAVFPFKKLPGTDTILGPEMRSTGEVMGIAPTFGEAYGKAQEASGNHLPDTGLAFLSVRDADKEEIVDVARRLSGLGLSLLATTGTAAYLKARGVVCESVLKVSEGSPNCVDRIMAGDVALVVNTTEGQQEIRDSFSIRREALMRNVPYVTNLAAGLAAVGALERRAQVRRMGFDGEPVVPLQTYHARHRESAAWARRLTGAENAG